MQSVRIVAGMSGLLVVATILFVSRFGPGGRAPSSEAPPNTLFAA
jgi:hypothetical protein